METENQNRISHNIHNIRDHRDGHRQARIFLCPKYGRSRIKNCNKRKRKGCIQEVYLGISHYFRFHFSEDQMQQWNLKYHTDYSQYYSNRRDNKNQLFCRIGGIFCIFLSHVLGTDDGSSCCQCGKHLDHQHINRIHQRYRRDSRRSHVADHHRICRSHQRIQNLFHNHRHQQCPQLFVSK